MQATQPQVVDCVQPIQAILYNIVYSNNWSLDE